MPKRNQSATDSAFPGSAAATICEQFLQSGISQITHSADSQAPNGPVFKHKLLPTVPPGHIVSKRFVAADVTDSGVSSEQVRKFQ